MAYWWRDSASRVVMAVVCTVYLGACGGGGGGGSSHPNSPGIQTTFTGNLSQPSAADIATGDAVTAAAGVQVCVAGTDFCTDVNEDGTFTLAADIGGDVVLVFTAPDFTARLSLSDVPQGATVNIQNIECSTTTGRCQAENVVIVNPANEPPICDMAAARPATLWPPNHQLVPIAIVGVFDPDGDRVDVMATAVTSNEADNAPGSGNTSPDAQLDPLAVRAERSGQGSGRVYTIDFVADDGHGNTCTGTVQVCVPHDQGHGAQCG
jgi:hypothetical protein